MYNNEQDNSLSGFEIFILMILTIIVYVGGIMLLYFPIALYMPVWFFGPIGFIIIIGFDVFWIIKRKSHISSKINDGIINRIPSLLVFSLSASILTCWLLLNVMRMFRW